MSFSTNIDVKLKCNRCGYVCDYGDAEKHHFCDELGYTCETYYTCPNCGGKDMEEQTVMKCNICGEEKEYTDISFRVDGVCDECMERIEQDAIDILYEHLPKEEFEALTFWYDMPTEKVLKAKNRKEN